MNAPTVHDLLRIDPALASDWADAPAWVAAALARAPWVVVRRACASGGIPVGVRGAARAHRFGTRIARTDIGAVVPPVSLGSGANARDARPIALAARAVARAAQREGLSWGPTGSFGFELASGVPTTHPASDLDCVVAAAPRAALAAFAHACLRIETRTGVRIDAEVLYPAGGVALGEVLGGADAIIMKTAAGPRLVACPV